MPFNRLPKNKKIGDNFYVAKKGIENLYNSYNNGEDFDLNYLNQIVSLLQQIKSASKSFNSKDEIKGTEYDVFKTEEDILFSRGMIISEPEEFVVWSIDTQNWRTSNSGKEPSTIKDEAQWAFEIKGKTMFSPTMVYKKALEWAKAEATKVGETKIRVLA